MRNNDDEMDLDKQVAAFNATFDSEGFNTGWTGRVARCHSKLDRAYQMSDPVARLRRLQAFAQMVNDRIAICEKPLGWSQLGFKYIYRAEDLIKRCHADIDILIGFTNFGQRLQISRWMLSIIEKWISEYEEIHQKM